MQCIFVSCDLLNLLISSSNSFVDALEFYLYWQPTPVLLPGQSYGWRSLVGYSQWRQSDTTEHLHYDHIIYKWFNFPFQSIYLFCGLVAKLCMIFATLWTVCSPLVSSVHGISQREYWSGLPFSSPWDLYQLSHQGGPFIFIIYFTKKLFGFIVLTRTFVSCCINFLSVLDLRERMFSFSVLNKVLCLCR